MHNKMLHTAEFGSHIRRVKLEEQTEIRITEERSSSLKLRLLDGDAEIFGSELPLKVWLTFPPHLKFAVFTWLGATVEIDDVTGTEYISYKTPMISYLKDRVHNSLQVQRLHVTSSTRDSVFSQGPRVVIVGDKDTGKTTLAKMLLSWAVKDGWKPTFVDLSVGQSSIAIPGTIAATSVETPLDPIEGFPLDNALVHYFGHITPCVNVELYKAQVEELSRELEEDFAGNAESRASGMVIDTMGWINGLGYELLVHAIRKLNASVVIVLGQEAKLVDDLNNLFRLKKNVQILNLEKSNGVFSRNSTFRKILRSNNIHSYFNGVRNDLTFYTKMAKFSDVQIYQIGDLQERSRTRGNDNDPLKITPVKMDKEHLVDKVLAISYAKQSQNIISSIVAGFICIKDVDIDEERITYISPSAAELPSKILILGTLTWHET